MRWVWTAPRHCSLKGSGSAARSPRKRCGRRLTAPCARPVKRPRVRAACSGRYAGSGRKGARGPLAGLLLLPVPGAARGFIL